MDCVMVVGGAGYIGSHTVFELIENGYDVVVLDNLSTGYREAIHKDAKFYEGDVRNEAFLNYVFKSENIDFVVDFAAFSLVSESMKLPLKYYDNNLVGTKTLIENMLKNKVYSLIFSSTAAVYGNPETIPIVETQNKNPTNCYGETKLAIENMLYWVSLSNNLNYVCLRYFNACGAHTNGLIGEAHRNETHLIPIVVEAAIGKRDHINIYGVNYDTKDKTAIRDYVHVLDLANAHILSIEYLKNGGKSDSFNLGNGVGFSVKEIIKTTEQIVNKKILVKEEKRRKGDPSILVASSEKARKILGWVPSFTKIEDIIKTAYIWHKNNITGYYKQRESNLID